METTTISERGQISVPASLRKKYNLKPGTEIEWFEKPEGIFLSPIPSDPIAAFRGQGSGETELLLKKRKEDRTLEMKKRRK